MESWSEFSGEEAGGKWVAVIRDSELAVGLVEGSNRAMSVLCLKDPSTCSGDRDDSCCSCASGLGSAEGVGEEGAT